MLNFIIGLGIFIVGGIVGIGIMAIFNINKVDVKAYSYRLRQNIIKSLTHDKECWKALATKDNLYLIGKIEATKTAIHTINKEFDKAESEVEG